MGSKGPASEAPLGGVEAARVEDHAARGEAGGDEAAMLEGAPCANDARTAPSSARKAAGSSSLPMAWMAESRDASSRKGDVDVASSLAGSHHTGKGLAPLPPQPSPLLAAAAALAADGLVVADAGSGILGLLSVPTLETLLAQSPQRASSGSAGTAAAMVEVGLVDEPSAGSAASNLDRQGESKTTGASWNIAVVAGPRRRWRRCCRCSTRCSCCSCNC